MFNEFDQTRDGDDLYQEVQIENVEDYRTVRFSLAIAVAVSHPDVPEGVPAGTIYVQGTPRQLRQALTTQIPELLRDLEVGVSAARRAALSLAGDGPAVPRSTVAKPRVVRSRRQRR